MPSMTAATAEAKLVNGPLVPSTSLLPSTTLLPHLTTTGAMAAAATASGTMSPA